MRAHLINEKFTDKSDPIADMGIGGVNLMNKFTRIRDKATDEWIKFLKETLEGKIIKGTMMKWDNSHQWKQYTFRVKKVLNTKERDGFTARADVKDKDDIIYTIYVSEKLYITE